MKKYLCIAMCAVLLGACLCFAGCGANYGYDDSGFSVGETELSAMPDSIIVDWLGGSVEVKYHAESTILIAESGAIDDNMRLRWKLSDGELSVRYCAPMNHVVVGAGKKLTLTLPENFRADEIEFNTVSANVTTAVLTAQKIDVDTVSGNVSLWVANTAEVDIDTVSGRVDVVQNGTAQTIDVDTTSGKVTVQADNATSVSVDTTSGSVDISATQSDKVMVNTTSGNVSLQIPQEQGFTVTFGTVSGNANSQVQTTVQDGKYIYGNGKTKVSVGTVSGNVNFVK